MDTKAMFKLSYGMFVAGTTTSGKPCGCIINTGVQLTTEPLMMSVTMMKTNNTTQQILQSGSLALSVIGMDCDIDVIKDFGMRSGRDCDKFEGYAPKFDINGNPYIEKGICARISLKVVQKIELSSHWHFICQVVDCEVLSESDPMTYAAYRQLKAGGQKKKQWVCKICHYVYDGDVPFEDLPDDYVCPVCGQPKSSFEQQ